MSDERKRILTMLSEGKITPDEAERLIEALAHSQVTTAISEATDKSSSKFMYVKVESVQKDNVNVKIPLSLLRAGMKLTSLIPPQAMEHLNSQLKEKGMTFDFSNFKQNDIEELIKSIMEMEVNVVSKDGDTVKVYCA